ncbi:MAG TPA: alpha-amylase family glycosyl hydrolase [Candidatus Limnocylindrales bacterium]|nr:alpha-amylase family glycosyl hydrolase [Candidatus Limnocylindrales bacterium]
MRAIAVGRTARRRHRLDPLVGRDGSLDARDANAARRIAARLNVDRVGEPEAFVAGGDVTALAALGAVLHEVVRRDRAERTVDLETAAGAGVATVGPDGLERVDRAWRREFGDGDGAPPDLVAELLVLSALNDNTAARPVRELVDDRPLRDASPYVGFVGAIEQELGGRAARRAVPPPGGERGAGRPSARAAARDTREATLALPARLREPARRGRSLVDQLRWIRTHWAQLLATDPALAERVALAIDLLAEEARAMELRAAGAAFGGPVPAERPSYRGLDAEPEAFSPDTDWMPSVVLLAKSTHVWLSQLARTYGRPVPTLADIPDEELDRLAGLGITGLWLIGLWQRSRASAEIKRRRGDHDAVASAYSIDEYRIADDLGGEPAFESLKARAMARGIRMAADMVPNHMGLDSRWVIEQPDRFIWVAEPPYPAYAFGGPDLSPDPRVELTIEDHYWDGSDAAVVFRRRDRSSGDTRYLYHGNDGTSFPWNDTAQLDYLQPEVREAVIQTILAVARRAPILRFDAAMVLARRHIRRLWYPRPGDGGAIPSRAEHAIDDATFDALMPTEFWRQVVDRVAEEAPGTLLLAEAFWLLEGYFVRTLGMHRVYNSAFMHMLRDEDNAGYRRVMKDTLEFDPRVLQRFVNFMTNPDERPAAEQFGTGDKAFAVATLLATLPGLPMLGHGQVDGLRERYGMEFRAARWDEPVDRAHAEHFERTIVPLLRRRADFAGTERFHLYDAVADDGSIVEDVFAYSNEVDGRRSLVLVHNRQADADVTIDRSAAARRLGGGGRLSRTRLAVDLALPTDDASIRFRDPRTGWETTRTARELHDRGLRVHLGPYEAVVLDLAVATPEPVAQIEPTSADGPSAPELRAALDAGRRSRMTGPTAGRAAAARQSRGDSVARKPAEQPSARSRAARRRRGSADPESPRS